MRTQARAEGIPEEAGFFCFACPLRLPQRLNIAGTEGSERCGEGVKQATQWAETQDRELSGK
jgi:hypothetical protein